MDEQDVKLAAANNLVRELQMAIADEEREIQQLLSRIRNKADDLGGSVESSDLSEQAVDTLSWAVASVRTELQEAQGVLHGAVQRITEVESLIR